MTALPRPTRRGAALAGAGVGLVAIGGATGFTDVVRAGIFALLLLALALVLVAIVGGAMRGTHVTRYGPNGPMVAPGTGMMRIEADLPALIRFVDADLVEPHTFRKGAEERIPAQPHTSQGYAVEPAHRGVFSSGPTRLELRDPLGLARASRDVSHATEWIVWPPDQVLPEALSSSPGRGEETASSVIASQTGEPGASTRAYVRGDDTRLVHWPATAHRGELIIRQFDPPADDAIALELVGDVAEAGADETWEALIIHVAALWRHVHASRVPATLTVDDTTTHDLDRGLDALAAAGTCRSSEGRAPDVTTWAFVHTSAGALPDAPLHAAAHAVVTGSIPDRVSEVTDRLRHAGWAIHPLAVATRADADLTPSEAGRA